MAKRVQGHRTADRLQLCEWGETQPWLWGRQVGGQLWRTTGDISDRGLSMLGILDKQVGLEKYAGPDGWNDPDMLEVGNGRMTYDEYVAHFSLWALLNAPLIAGNDLRTMADSTRSILTNKDVIAVNQDWGGMQGVRIRKDSATKSGPSRCGWRPGGGAAESRPHRCLHRGDVRRARARHRITPHRARSLVGSGDRGNAGAESR